MNDLVVIAALSVGACAGVGALGALLLHRTRRASLRYQLVIATVLPVVAVAATVLINVQLMFLSAHDTSVIMLALAIALVLALAGCFLITHRLARASRRLQQNVGLLISDSRPTTSGSVVPIRTPAAGDVLPAELARVEHELDEARRTLAESRARERATEQARQELVSFLSHDLRTPLAGLRALSEGLEDGVITDVPRALGHLRGTVIRMTAMVDDLFALSRVQARPEAPAFSLVPLSELVLDVTAEAEAAARGLGVGLEVSVPDRDPLAVLGGHDDLSRALANLVSNAIRHTAPGRLVQVTADRAEDGTIRVAVRDGCGGIPDHDLGKVFDTGWRGSPAPGAPHQGGGLGLAIARGVVESHHGEIAVRNTQVGCCFEVALPRVDGAVASS